MEKKPRTSTLDSVKTSDSSSPETSLNYSNASTSPSDSSAPNQKRKKCKRDPYSHNSSLWRNLSYIFSTKTSSSANVKVIKEKESPIQRLSSFFKHKKSHNTNTIKPITNIGVSPKGYQVAISETALQPDYDKNLAVAIRLPKGTTSGNVAVTVEMDVPSISDEQDKNSDDKPMIMKCCEETDSLTVFTGLLKLPPNTDMAQLVNMPLYLIDSKEKIVLNAGYKLWHETIIKSSDDLLVGEKPNRIHVDDVRIKLKLEKDRKKKKPYEPHTTDIQEDCEVEAATEINKLSTKERTTSEGGEFRYDSVESIEENKNQNTSDNLVDLSCDSAPSLSETSDTKNANDNDTIDESLDQGTDNSEQRTAFNIRDIVENPSHYVIEPYEEQTPHDVTDNNYNLVALDNEFHKNGPKAYVLESDEEKTLYNINNTKQDDFSSVVNTLQPYEESNESDFTDNDNDIDYISELSDVTHIIYDSKGYINELSATKATKDDIREIISDSADYINELSVEDATTDNIKAIIYDSLICVSQHTDGISLSSRNTNIMNDLINSSMEQNEKERVTTGIINSNHDLINHDNKHSEEEKEVLQNTMNITYDEDVNKEMTILEADNNKNYDAFCYDNNEREVAPAPINTTNITYDNEINKEMNKNYDLWNYDNEITEEEEDTPSNTVQYKIQEEITVPPNTINTTYTDENNEQVSAANAVRKNYISLCYDHLVSEEEVILINTINNAYHNEVNKEMDSTAADVITKNDDSLSFPNKVCEEDAPPINAMNIACHNEDDVNSASYNKNYDQSNYEIQMTEDEEAATGDVLKANYGPMDFLNTFNTENATSGDIRSSTFSSTDCNNLPFDEEMETNSFHEIIDDAIDRTREVTDKKASTNIRKVVHKLVDNTYDLVEENLANNIEQIHADPVDFYTEKNISYEFECIQPDSIDFQKISEEGEGLNELTEIICDTADYVENKCNKQTTKIGIQEMLYESTDSATEMKYDDAISNSCSNEILPSHDGRVSETPKEESTKILVSDMHAPKEEDDNATGFGERSRKRKSTLVDEQVGYTVSPYPIALSNNLCNASTQYSQTLLLDNEVSDQNNLFTRRRKMINKHLSESSSPSDSSDHVRSTKGPRLPATKHPQILERNISADTVWPKSSTSMSTQYSSTLLSYPSVDYLRLAARRPSQISGNASSVETEWPMTSTSTMSRYSSVLPSINSSTISGYFQKVPENNPEALNAATLPTARDSNMLHPLSLDENIASITQKYLEISKSNASTETEWPRTSISTNTGHSDTLLSLPLFEIENTTNQKSQPSDNGSSVMTEWQLSGTSASTQYGTTLPSDVASCSFNEPANQPQASLNSRSSSADLDDEKLKIKCVRNALDFSLNTKNIDKLSLTYTKPEITRMPITFMGIKEKAELEQANPTPNMPITFASPEQELCSINFDNKIPKGAVKRRIQELDKTLELLKDASSILSSFTDDDNSDDEELDKSSTELVPDCNRKNELEQQRSKELMNVEIEWNITPFDFDKIKEYSKYQKEKQKKQMELEEQEEREKRNAFQYSEEKNCCLCWGNNNVCDTPESRKGLDLLLSGDNSGEDTISRCTEATSSKENLENSYGNDDKDSIIPSSYMYEVDSINQRLNTEINKLQQIYGDLCSKLDETSDSATNRSTSSLSSAEPRLERPISSEILASVIKIEEQYQKDQERIKQLSLAKERSETYTTVENDIKHVIQELLKESEDIKEVAILQGAKEDPEPPFFFEYIEDWTELGPIEICQEVVDDLVNSSMESSKETKDDYNNKAYDRNEDVQDILDILLESVVKSRNILESPAVIPTETSQSNDILESINFLFEAKGNCTNMHIGDVNCLNKTRNYITECENKQNHINKYITYFCNTTVFNSKIPKTSYSFGEVPCKNPQIHHSIFKTSAKHRDGSTITGMEYLARDLETSRLFKEILNFNLKPRLSTREQYIFKDEFSVPKTDLYIPPYEMITYKNSVVEENVPVKENNDNLENSNSNTNCSEHSMENKEETQDKPTYVSGTKFMHKSQKFVNSVAPLQNNRPGPSTTVYKETKTTDEEEIMRNLEFEEEAITSSSEPEYLLPVHAGTGKRFSKCEYQKLLHTPSSSSEEELVRYTSRRTSKSNKNNVEIIEIKPKTSIISDSESGCLIESIVIDDEASQNSHNVLKPTQGLRNMQCMLNNHTEASHLHQESEVSEKEYEGDQDSYQIRMPNVKQRYKSMQELNTLQEIAEIERNVRENDLLTRRNLIVITASTTSSLFEYEDSLSATPSNSEQSLFVQSEDSVEVGDIRLTNSSLHHPKTEPSQSASTI